MTFSCFVHCHGYYCPVSRLSGLVEAQSPTHTRARAQESGELWK